MKEINGFPKDYTIFDLETTGYSRQKDKIIEIAAIKVRDHKVVDTFSMLVNPMIHIKEEVSNINHITDDMVKDAPEIKDAMAKFLDFIGNDILIGHNIQVFDLKFIERDAKTINRELENEFIDTLHMAKKASLKGEKFRKNSLEALAEYYGISSEGNHRALKDCEINLEIYQKFRQVLEKKDVKKEFVGGDEMEENKKFYLYVTGPKWVKYNHFKEKVLYFLGENKDAVLVTDNVGVIGEHISRLAKECGFEKVMIRGEWLTEGCDARKNRDKKIMTFLKERNSGVLTFWGVKHTEAMYLYSLCTRYGVQMKVTK